MEAFGGQELAGLAALLFVFVGLWGCGTTSSFLDAALPDRYGLGSSFTSGGYSGRQIGQTGADTIRETGKYELDSIVTWLEWDIPSVGADPVSVRGVRERVVQDYRDWREPEPEKESLLSVTRHTSVDEATGAVSESWSFGAAEALSSALIGLLSFLGFRLARSRFTGSSAVAEDDG